MRFIRERPWTLVIAYMIGIFVLSSFSALPQPPYRGIDKPEHYIEYGGLAIVAIWAICRMKPNLNLLVLALTGIAIASVYGVTDEFHQKFVPNRSCDPLDWVCDTLGAITGALIIIAIIHFKRKITSVEISNGGETNGKRREGTGSSR